MILESHFDSRSSFASPEGSSLIGIPFAFSYEECHLGTWSVVGDVRNLLSQLGRSQKCFSSGHCCLQLQVFVDWRLVIVIACHVRTQGQSIYGNDVVGCDLGAAATIVELERTVM
jgi:hypothetical protein